MLPVFFLANSLGRNRFFVLHLPDKNDTLITKSKFKAFFKQTVASRGRGSACMYGLIPIEEKNNANSLKNISWWMNRFISGREAAHVNLILHQQYDGNL